MCVYNFRSFRSKFLFHCSHHFFNHNLCKNLYLEISSLYFRWNVSLYHVAMNVTHTSLRVTALPIVVLISILLLRLICHDGLGPIHTNRCAFQMFSFSVYLLGVSNMRKEFFYLPLIYGLQYHWTDSIKEWEIRNWISKIDWRK